MPDAIDDVVAFINKVFIRSKINIKLKTFCITQLTHIPDNKPRKFLSDFKRWAYKKKKWSKTDDADSAYFLTAHAGQKSVGLGKMSGRLAWSKFFSRQSFISIAHELGHNFGLSHNYWETSAGHRNIMTSEAYQNGANRHFFTNYRVSMPWGPNKSMIPLGDKRQRDDSKWLRRNARSISTRGSEVAECAPLCPTGHHRQNGTCVVCAAGSYTTDYRQPCLPCEKDSWSADAASVCLGCEEGTFTDGTAATKACTAQCKNGFGCGKEQSQWKKCNKECNSLFKQCASTVAASCKAMCDISWVHPPIKKKCERKCQANLAVEVGSICHKPTQCSTRRL